MEHFPNIVEHCREMGYDVTKECIPVVPAQHYFMGGVWVDHESHTSMERLYAVGETACNGVHGKNRLASNSLLESLVFAKRAAKQMSGQKETISAAPELFAAIDRSIYADAKALSSQYHEYVREAIIAADAKMQQVQDARTKQRLHFASSVHRSDKINKKSGERDVRSGNFKIKCRSMDSQCFKRRYHK